MFILKSYYKAILTCNETQEKLLKSQERIIAAQDELITILKPEVRENVDK